MINVDVDIERISNGYVVTGNDSTRQKRYYVSLTDFIEISLKDDLLEIQNMYRQLDYEEKRIRAVIKFDFIQVDGDGC